MITKVQHTSGPWFTRDKNRVQLEFPEQIYVKCEDGTPIHIAYVPTRECAESHANARLIAAAPDLLAALEQVDDDLIENEEGSISLQTMQQLRAAIAKAKGE